MKIRHGLLGARSGRARHAEIVKLRVFWGMDMKEIAETLGVSISTVEKDWRFARAWLRTQLEG